MLKEFWDSLISTLPKDILQTLFSFVVAIVVLLIGLRLIKWLIAHLKKTKLSARIDPTVHTFILSVISIGLKLLLVIAAFPMRRSSPCWAARDLRSGLHCRAALQTLQAAS